jgi:hypothetical protein
MQLPPITRSLGAAERSLRALLERELAKRSLRFAEWTALVFTASAPLEPEEVARRQIAGHIVPEASASVASVERLLTDGLMSRDPEGKLQQTERGQQVFKELSAAIETITQAAYGHIPHGDLDATHRTLLEIGSCADALLSQAALMPRSSRPATAGRIRLA